MNKILAYFAIATAVALVVSTVSRWIPNRQSLARPPFNRLPYFRKKAAPTGPVTPKEQNSALEIAAFKGYGSAVFAAVVFIALFRPSIAVAGTASFSIALNCGLSASAGFLFYSALPATKVPATILRGYKRLVLPLAAGALLLAGIIAAGVLSVPGTENKYQALRTPSGETIEPFPGWQFGMPLIVVEVILIASAVSAIIKLMRVRLLGNPRLTSLDAAARSATINTIGCLTAGLLMTTLGGLAISAAQAFMRAPDLSGAGIGAWLVGIASLGAGVVLFFFCLKTVIRFRQIAVAS